MSKVIGTITLRGTTFDITTPMYGYGHGYGWSEGPGPDMRGCTGFDTIGEAVDHAITTMLI